MTTLKKLRALAVDKSGAALIEYSLLIGLITASVVIMVFLVAGWVILRWGSLQAALGF